MIKLAVLTVLRKIAPVTRHLTISPFTSVKPAESLARSFDDINRRVNLSRKSTNEASAFTKRLNSNATVDSAIPPIAFGLSEL